MKKVYEVKIKLVKKYTMVYYLLPVSNKPLHKNKIIVKPVKAIFLFICI